MTDSYDTIIELRRLASRMLEGAETTDADINLCTMAANEIERLRGRAREQLPQKMAHKRERKP